MGRLPEQTNANLQMVSALQRQLESNAHGAARRAGSAVDDRAADRSDAAGRRRDAVRRDQGTPGETAAMHVQTLRRQLADAQLTYTDKHPEIVRLKDELATAEKAEAAERARPAADRAGDAQCASPEYRQLHEGSRRDEDADLGAAAAADGDQRCRSRSTQTRVESGAARRAADGLAAARVRPRTRRPTRDLTRQEAGGAARRGTAAQTGRRAVRGARAGEPADGAVQAEADARDADGDCRRLRPRRRAAFGREYLDRSVHDARGLRDEFELPVLAEIPRIEPVMP